MTAQEEHAQIDVPSAWERLNLEDLNGTILIAGGTNTGKSTLVRYLAGRLIAAGQRVAYVDGDPGQSTLGPPTTVTMALSAGRDDAFPPSGETARWFVGATSPRRHMLPLLAGAARLVRSARAAGAEAVLYDSSGMVDPAQGGTALKQAFVDVLQPAAVIAIQKQDELEPLLRPWRRLPSLQLVELSPAPAVRERDAADRQDYRARRFAAYFEEAQPLTLRPPRYAVLPRLHFRQHQLLALRDAGGFTQALAIVLEDQKENQQLTVLTPLSALDGVTTLELGDLLLDPETFRDAPL
ncbi:MAG: polynucleotide 5'-hydroxyl-kinase [Candidatus Promineifilaceae bacterium]|nr:polynucleotide 5'-hydroxyl-kinase [Candidatus Promineifilaceae bacterium]